MDGKRVELALWDTAGQEDYDRLRPLSYPDSHVILICFAVDSPDSLDNVQEKWISEVNHFCPGLPIILVGCKKDLRYDQKTQQDLAKSGQEPVLPQQVIHICSACPPLFNTFANTTSCYYSSFRVKNVQRKLAQPVTSNVVLRPEKVCEKYSKQQPERRCFPRRRNRNARFYRFRPSTRGQAS